MSIASIDFRKGLFTMVVIKTVPSNISLSAVDYFRNELQIVAKETGHPISTPKEIAELVSSTRELQATTAGITHGDRGLAENLYRAVLGIKQSTNLQEAGADEIFSVEAQSLYKAILDNEWDPMALKSPAIIAEIVYKDERLALYRTGDKKKDKEFFDETYRYAIFETAKSLMGDPDNDNYQMRTNPLSKQELADFIREFLTRLEGTVKPQSLYKEDVQKAVERNKVLADLVKSLTDGNEDLVTTLYSETVEYIQKKHGCL